MNPMIFIMRARLVIVCVLVSLVAFNATLLSQEPDPLRAEDILRMSFYDLMNIEVISASKVPQQIKDVSATVHVISAEQIRERGYFTWRRHYRIYRVSSLEISSASIATYL